MHQLDARSKIIMLLIYSICLFFIDTWVGMAIAAALFVLAFVLSQLPASKLFGMVVPVYVLVFVVVVCNMFVFQDNALQITQAGISHGIFYGIRILLLVWACLIVCLTSTSMQLTNALNSFLKPLRRFRVPTDDIATIFTIALRFIPLMAQEFFTVKSAQQSRGANFSSGGLLAKMKSYTAVLIPMFVGLFRRADKLALAMDARAYGLGQTSRTSLNTASMQASSILFTVLACGIFTCVAVCF